MNYKVGQFNIKSNIDLPSCYDAFICRYSLGDKETFDVTIDKSTEEISFLNAVNIAKHNLMSVWKKDDGWLFENNDHSGVLEVSRDYSYGRFYCTRDEYSDVLRPLLQMMVECRFIYKDVMILHAACVCKDGKAVAFSAPSGTGKSKRACRWVEHLDATWISGDRPAVDPKDGVAYGVPWDGKEQIFVNISAPIQAIAEVRRSGKTFVRKMTQKQKTKFLATQLMIPMWDVVLTQKVFVGIKKIIEKIPIYRLFCDISEKSVKDSYDILFNNLDKVLEEKDDRLMKIKEGFEIVEIAGDYMAIPVGDNMAIYGGSVALNDVSAFLLNSMKNPITEEELLHLLMNEYEVDEETASEDLKNITDIFESIGLIEK